MSLDSTTIDESIRRYRREFDCYEKLARIVAGKCEKEIVRKNTLRATVTYRAKSPSKLKDKLEKKYRLDVSLNTANDALRRMTDLAGVRISTYLEFDRARVVEELKKLFDEVEVDVKDAPGKHYRATHCQVKLKPEDFQDENDNLEGLTCEIQVCSMLAHVWNELEHDLVYKPTTGNLSERETDSLNILATMTTSGDTVIKQLFEANADRIKQAQDDEGAFLDVYDFVVRMRDSFPKCNSFGNNAGQLYENLVQLGFDSPTKVRLKLLADNYTTRSEELLQKMQEFLAAHHDDTVTIEPLSSDALLILALDSYVDQILANNPMGRGRGRPPRIASFATRFKEMRSTPSDSATRADA